MAEEKQMESASLTLRDAQARVDAFIREHGGYWEEFVILARMAEELGEVAAALQRLRGFRPRKVDVDLAGEVGDMLFILAAFANSQGMDLGECLEQVLAKYQARDSAAWKERAAEPPPA